MYSEKIRVANRIISSENLLKIFEKMNESILENQKKYRYETSQNEKYKYEYQNWTVGNFKASFEGKIAFNDKTSITFENYNNFITIFNCRLQDIESLRIYYSYAYFIKEENNIHQIHQSISIDIRENSFVIELKLDNSDKKMYDVYKYIKDIFTAAPIRYDEIIKNKNLIKNKIKFSIGFIPGFIICIVLCFFPKIIHFFSASYILYPLILIILSFVLGDTFIDEKLEKLYLMITPQKKYVKFDFERNRKIYDDGMNEYALNSEILIGKNIDNFKKRKEIKRLEEKYSKFIFVEILLIIVSSLLIIFI